MNKFLFLIFYISNEINTALFRLQESLQKIDDCKRASIKKYKVVWYDRFSAFSHAINAKLFHAIGIARLNIILFIGLGISSCGTRNVSGGSDLSPTKQKQKIVFLQKKLQIAEKEQKKVQSLVERLTDEVREAELSFIRRQIDEYEELIRKYPGKKAEFDSSLLFLEARERLHRMIQSSDSVYEAQVVLDRILQLITELGDVFPEKM